MQQLIRLPEVFAPFHEEILKRLGIASAKLLGREYWLFSSDRAMDATHQACGLWLRWQMRVDHAWPCVPEQTIDFFEKATTALQRKCDGKKIQQVMVSPLLAGSPNPYYKKLATRLQQRLRQECAPTAMGRDPQEQEADGLSLFVLLGKEGLFATIATPRQCGGFYAGGSKFFSHSAEHSISRAGAKVAEALHLLKLFDVTVSEQAHWLELGASPGGMTAELLERGYRVTAIDRAPMDPRLVIHSRLTCIAENALTFLPPRGVNYDALLCDMNGSAVEALAMVLGKIPHLRAGALVIFTMKAHKAAGVDDILALHETVQQQARKGGLIPLAQRHLTYNRHEFTLFWRVP